MNISLGERSQEFREVATKISWAVVCGALLLAGSVKLLNLDLFCRYLGTVLDLPSVAVKPIAYIIVLVELGLPVLSIIPRLTRFTAVLAVGLFACFTVFHATRSLAGDPLPCTCFGKILTLPPTSFSVLTAILGLMSAVVATYSLTAGMVWSKLPTASKVMWVLTMCCLFALEGKYVYAVASPVSSDAILINISPDELTKDGVNISQSRGKKYALVMFGDFQCKFCKSAFDAISPTFEEDVEVFWRDLPLRNIHDRATPLAVIGRIAGNRGQLRATIDQLFKAGSVKEFSVSDSMETILGGPPSAEEVKDATSGIDADFALAKNLKLTGTPALFAISGTSVFKVPNIESARKIFYPFWVKQTQGKNK